MTPRDARSRLTWLQAGLSGPELVALVLELELRFPDAAVPAALMMKKETAMPRRAARPKVRASAIVNGWHVCAYPWSDRACSHSPRNLHACGRMPGHEGVCVCGYCRAPALGTLRDDERPSDWIELDRRPGPHVEPVAAGRRR